jgi:polyisoprenyl-teichoic acid--peptidoglycan teichoic acid transferase
VSSPTKPPYRRFRARARRDDGGLDALRQLNRPEDTPGATPPRDADRPELAPAPQPRPSSGPDRERRRALERAGRRWWSFRGLGPGGWIGRVVLVLVVGFVFWLGAGYLALRGAVADANSRVTASARKALAPQDGGFLTSPTNTLLIGSDARTGKGGRADTILIMRTDPNSGRVKYLSIPRDFRVEIPGYGQEKINSAFSIAGQGGIIRAVTRLTGLPIHHIMVINFRGFPRLVNELGGVDVVNPTRLVDCYYENGKSVSFPRGRQRLNGANALAFARVRKCDSDFQRAARQQALVAGIKSEILSFGHLWKAPWQGAALVRTLNTDIGTLDMAKLGWLQGRLQQDPADRIVLAGSTTTIGGQSFVVGDPGQNEPQIARFIGGS